MEAHNARLGLILFIVYTVVYAGFVLLALAGVLIFHLVSTVSRG